jgi:hypothetical protein
LSFKEIRCPHCKQWTLWAGNNYDRCLYCDGFLESERFTVEVEKKILDIVRTEADPLFVKPTDTKRMGDVKNGLRVVRSWTFYVQAAFFGFITLVLVILAFCAA